MGTIMESVTLTMMIQDYSIQETFLIAQIGPDDAMIGIDWLKNHNPEINWMTRAVKFTRCPSNCRQRSQSTTLDSQVETTEEDLEPDTELEPELSYYLLEQANIYSTRLEPSDQIWIPTNIDIIQRIAAGFTASQAIAKKTTQKEGDKTFEEMVPIEFRQFKNTFPKKASE
jgi:hypothetical protein